MNTIEQALAAYKKLVQEAADNRQASRIVRAASWGLPIRCLFILNWGLKRKRG